MAEFNDYEKQLEMAAEEALNRYKSISEFKALKAGRRSFSESNAAARNLKALETSYKQAYAKAAKETQDEQERQKRAEQYWTLMANRRGIKNPTEELGALQLQVKELAAAGGYDPLRRGALPPQLEQLARTGQPWVPTPQMQIAEQVREGTISPADRSGALRELLKAKEPAVPATVGPPSKMTPGDVVTDLFNLLAVPGRAVAGYAGAVLQEARAETEPGAEKFLGADIQKLFGPGPEASAIAQNPLLADLMLQQEVAKPEVEIMRGLEKPEDFVAKWSGRLKGVYENVVTEGQSAKYSIPGIREEILAPYRKEFGADSYKQAQQELPDGTPQQWQDRADELIIDKIPNEQADLILKHPYLSQLALELVPELLTPAGTVRKVLKALLPEKVVSAGGIVKEALGDIPLGAGGRTLGSAFEADYNVNKLARRGKTEEAAALAMVEPKARYAVQQAYTDMDRHIKRIDELVTTPEDKELLFYAVENRGMEKMTDQGFVYLTPDDVDDLVRSKPNVQMAFEEQAELQKAHEAVREYSGAAQSWKGDVLHGPATVAEGTYVPHALEIPDANYQEVAKTKFIRRGGPIATKPSSTKERRAIDYIVTEEPPPTVYAPDITQQWKTALKAEKQKHVNAAKIRQTSEIMEEAGLVDNVPTADLAMRQKELQELTGQNWVSLESAVNNVWQEVSGLPGIKKGATETLVPEFMLPHIRTLVADADVKSAGGLLKVTKDSLGFANRMFSKINTAVWPGFHSMQAVSNLMLLPFLMGKRAFNVKQHAGALSGAALNMLEDPQLAKGLKFVAKNGEESTKYDIIMAARERGILPVPGSDIDIAAGLSSRGVGVSSLENAMNKTIDKTVIGALPGKLAQAEDNAMKLFVYESFVDGLDSTSLDIAAKKTNEFISNWNSMGWAEREYLQNVIPFYSWQRYGVFKLLPRLAEEPQRISAALKSWDIAENYLGQNAPYTAYGIPENLQGQMVTAPFQYQPEAQKQKIIQASAQLYDTWEKAGRPALGSQEFVALTYDNPAMLAIPLVSALAGGNKNEAARMAFPMLIWVKEMISGTNWETGAPMTRVPTSYEQYRVSPHAELAKTYVKRTSDAAQNLLKLFSDDPMQQISMDIMLNLANNLGPAAQALNPFLPEDRQIPLLPPGTRGRLVSPVLTGEWERVKGTEGAYEQKRQYKKTRW